MNTPLELSEIGLQEEWSFRVLSRGGGGGGEKRGRKEGRKREGQDVCEEEEVSSRERKREGDGGR